MKELTIQEKAEAYDNALKVLHKYDGANIMFSQSLKEEMFPELRESDDESDDERIRKALINEFIYLQSKGWKFAGLEGEDIIAWLEKQVEQKTTKKIVPKFHEDDWVVSPNGVYWHIDAIRNGRYQVSSYSGYDGNWSLDTNIYHRFTIKDAKPGDVLYDGSNACIFRKKMEDDDAIWVDAYCGINSDGMFNVNDENECWCLACNCVPATKEQCDSLMKAMADAGWEFDVEKKELKKIKYTRELDNSYDCVKFPFMAKVKSTGAIVKIHDGQLSQDGKEWIKYQSNVEDGFRVYEANDLELVCKIK